MFGDFKLVIDKSTGCFNATKLSNFGVKKFKHWTTLEKSKRLLTYYGSKSCAMYEVRLTNNDDLNKLVTGQYLPQEFLQPLIDWIKLPKASSTQGVVYVITNSFLESDNIYYKIGYTKNFQQRLDTFNEYRHSREPQFYPVALFSTSDAKKLETTVHKKLKDFRSEGEFFECNLSVINEAFKDEECELEEYEDNQFEI